MKSELLYAEKYLHNQENIPFYLPRVVWQNDALLLILFHLSESSYFGCKIRIILQLLNSSPLSCVLRTLAQMLLQPLRLISVLWSSSLHSSLSPLLSLHSSRWNPYSTRISSPAHLWGILFLLRAFDLRVLTAANLSPSSCSFDWVPFWS